MRSEPLKVWEETMGLESEKDLLDYLQKQFLVRKMGFQDTFLRILLDQMVKF